MKNALPGCARAGDTIHFQTWIGCDRERGRTGTYFSLLENSLAGGVVLQVKYLEQLFQLLFGELAEGGDVAKVVQDLQCGEQPESSCRRST